MAEVKQVANPVSLTKTDVAVCLTALDIYEKSVQRRINAETNMDIRFILEHHMDEIASATVALKR